ncbi:MAG: HAD family hydrolase [Ruminococcaceae bacterium]|nr:HAD family hydrolase [Oscillospiraceae bacterium]
MNKKLPFVIDEDININSKPSLLLHSCCAPCSSSVLEMLCEHFEVTVFYYNPNIFPESEYEKRLNEQKRFCKEFSNQNRTIGFLASEYCSEDFESASKELENVPEGGKRCTQCYRLRLEKTAMMAFEKGFDYFASTLSVSPLKDAKRLNAIGEELSKKYGTKYLVSDFKKQNGYKRSTELSKQYNMYRQDFCGCKYSLAERIMSAKAFIFDADGTLFDTMNFYEDFANRYLVMQGYEPEANIREKIRAKTITECCEYIKEKYKIEKSVDEIQDDLSKMLHDLYAKETGMKDGVFEFLKYSKQKGIRMCIATATAKNLLSLTLEHLGLQDYFEFVLTCPEVGATKREAKIYDECVRMLDLSQRDAVVFEDAHHAMITAKDAGYRVVAVREETELKFMEEILANCDIHVDSMMDLINRENL